MMELIAYEAEERTIINENGEIEIVDGSTKVLSD